MCGILMAIGLVLAHSSPTAPVEVSVSFAVQTTDSIRWWIPLHRNFFT